MLLSNNYSSAIVSSLASAHAISVDEANAISSGETDARIEALNRAVAQADAGTAVFLQALADDAVKLVRGKAIMVRTTRASIPPRALNLPCPTMPRT